MGQLFTSRATTIFRVALVLGPLTLVGAAGMALVWARSGSAWDVGKPKPQPIPFRHDLHAGRLGLDCRYCHSSVERAASAGMPTAETCMTCHAQVWVGASVLEPLRSAVALDQAIRWSSVSRLPAHAYFHHAAHVAAGVACETCHGRVDEMARTVKAQTLSMGFCLDCHRDPAPRLRPPDAVFVMGWTPKARGGEGDPVRRGHADVHRLTSCNTCHR